VKFGALLQVFSIGAEHLLQNVIEAELLDNSYIFML
jgi:hypothetical protein